jgi:hypothetical protein
VSPKKDGSLAFQWFLNDYRFVHGVLTLSYMIPSTMKLAILATLLATATAFSFNKAEIGKVGCIGDDVRVGSFFY